MKRIKGKNINTMSLAKVGLHKVQGLSLVELLVAIALSAFLLFGVIQIFITNKQTSTYQNSFGEIQESGRIASELIARDLRLAGHWGCAPSLADITSKLNDGVPGIDVDDVGIDNTRGGFSIKYIDDAGGKVGEIDVKPKTDIITIRGAKAFSNVRIVAAMANASDTISISADNVGVGSVVLISDCQQGDIFTITGTANGAVAGTVEVSHGEGLTNKSDTLSKAYDQKAQLLRLFTRQYFVGLNPDGGHSLYLKENTDDPSEVVRNIEDLEFSLAKDTTGNGSANQFNLKSTTVGNMGQVVSVKIDIHTESTNQSVSEGKPLARVYSMTANLRNRSL